jgi:uncharacterized membrane protein
VTGPAAVNGHGSYLRAPVGLILPTAIIGVGLSGFFDGILLHQVLQWHHLLSLVPGEPFRDIGTQILADGLFHIFMYLVTAAGLWLLWRRRSQFALNVAGWRTVVGGGLTGFGLWNIIDVGFFHWILGIHRIRVQVPDPLLYDVAWLIALGLIPLGLAWRILHNPGSASQGTGAAAASLTVLTLLAAGMAARPVPNSRTALVFFAPGTSAGEALNVATDAHVALRWMDERGRVIAVSLDDPDAERRLYRAGALLVTRSPVLAGCGTASAV